MEKTLCLIAFSALALVFSLPGFAEDECREVSCDCDSLTIDSWKTSCSNQEARIVVNCFKRPGKNVGHCSLHCPREDAVPLALKLQNVTAVNLEEAVQLNNKVAVLYWSLFEGFEALTASIKDNNIKEANGSIDTLEHDFANLFETQKIVAISLATAGQKSKAQLSWRDYSGDNLGVSTDVYIVAESLLNTYDSQEDAADREKMRNLGLGLMFLAEKMYEQVGYSYSQGERHKHAAQAWKNVSKASALVMAHHTC
jgi:hypothetical protein